MSISRSEAIEQIRERVELKSLDVARNLSEETLAYTATVYVDGEIGGQVKNRGRGGMSMLSAFVDRRGGSPTRKSKIDTLRQIADDLPPVDTRFGELEYKAEDLIDMLAEQKDFEADITRKVRNGKIVFQTADQTGMSFSHIPANGEDMSAVLIYVTKNEGLDIDRVWKDGGWVDVNLEDGIAADSVTYGA